MRNEFLLTNEKGSVCNLSVDGEINRMYSGYLTASFCSPQDRVMIMDFLQEEAVDEVIKSCENRGFRYHVLPEYSCRAGAYVYTKRIFLSHKTNAVRIDYLFHEVPEKGIIRILPGITFRSPDSPKTDTAVSFNRELRNNFVQLVPKPDTGRTGYILLTAMGARVDAEFERQLNNIRYHADEATGFEGMGNSLVPCCFEASPGCGAVISLVCGAFADDSELNFKLLTELLNCDAEGLEKEYLYKLTGQEYIDYGTAGTDMSQVMCQLKVMADRFIMKRESTGYKTILAGYPWFLDWGRDTMISFHGLTLSTGRYEDAREILFSFDKYIRHGMLPNVFPASSSEEPQYNTVDASLWYFYAIDMYVKYAPDGAAVVDRLLPGMAEILRLYSRSREEMETAEEADHCYGIYMDSNGRIHAGDDASDQLTWMDVRVDGRAVTPRHGTPVEIQALWINAVTVFLRLAAANNNISGGVKDIYSILLNKYEEIKGSMLAFVNPDNGALYDFIDTEKGIFDASVRPNQLWAVALPIDTLPKETAKRIVDLCREKLVVRLGIRSLAPEEEGYKGKYEGDLRSRDLAYHMGTAWGFLLEPYVTAYIKVYGDTVETAEYLGKLIRPYVEHLNEGCLGGVAEVFDGDEPKEGKGCYSQAWSVAALIRALECVMSVHD